MVAPRRALSPAAPARATFKPGEVIEGTVEGIGTLRHPVVAGKPLPTDLTGARLAPIGTYEPTIQQD